MISNITSKAAFLEPSKQVSQGLIHHHVNRGGIYTLTWALEIANDNLFEQKKTIVAF